MQASLQMEWNLLANYKLAGSIMRELGPRDLTQRSFPRQSIENITTASEFVNRHFTIRGTNHLWMTGITEHPTPRAVSVVDVDGKPNFPL